MRGLVARLARIALRLALLVAGTLLLGVVAYRWIDPPATPLMLLRLGEAAGIDYRPVPLGRMAPHLAAAVIAAEDNRFCLHWGIDWNAVGEAIDEYQDGEPLRGASTITMQTARNLFLWPGGGFPRKAVEAGLALAIEVIWPKRRIVEVYLNVAEWGEGVYGAEAAARVHFRKSAASLTRQEAARLAAVLPSPRRRHAGRPTAAVARRATMIDRRVDQLGPLLACSR